MRDAIANGTLGRGSIAGDEYIHNMQEARIGDDGVAQYFELLSVKDAPRKAQVPS